MIEAKKEVILENDLAYMYLFKPNFGIGAEARNHIEMVEGEMEHAALFAGPTLFYSHKNFFAIMNVLPQITNLKTGKLDLHDHQKLTTRLLLGFSF